MHEFRIEGPHGPPKISSSKVYIKKAFRSLIFMHDEYHIDMIDCD